LDVSAFVDGGVQVKVQVDVNVDEID